MMRQQTEYHQSSKQHQNLFAHNETFFLSHRTHSQSVPRKRAKWMFDVTTRFYDAAGTQRFNHSQVSLIQIKCVWPDFRIVSLLVLLKITKRNILYSLPLICFTSLLRKFPFSIILVQTIRKRNNKCAFSNEYALLWTGDLYEATFRSLFFKQKNKRIPYSIHLSAPPFPGKTIVIRVFLI